MAQFLYDFCPVAGPIRHCGPRLLDVYGPVLADAAAAAFGDGHGALRTGEPRRRDDAVIIPIAWTVEAGPRPDTLFEQLDGDLQLAPLDAGVSHLSLSATCHRASDGDDALARRLAEERVRLFLRLVAERLERLDQRPR